MSTISDKLKAARSTRMLVEIDFEGLVKRWSTENIMVEHPGARMPSDDNLVGYWPLNGDVKDYSGSGNDGSVAGAVTYPSGVVGSCLQEGAAGIITIATPSNNMKAAFETGDFSFSFWWRPSIELSFADLISFLFDGNQFRFEHGTDTGSGTGFWFGENTGVGHSIWKGGYIPYDEWVHNVAIYDRTNDEMRVYTDAEYITPIAPPNTPLEDFTVITNLEFFASADLPGERLDEIRIYDKALTTNEIKALYNSPSGATGHNRLFEGKMLNEVSIASSYNFESQSTSLREITFNVANDDRFQDQEVRRRLDGSSGSVYIWADGLEWADIDIEGVIFRGIFRKKYHDKFTYSFSLAEQPLVQFGVVPSTTINEDTWPIHRTAGGGGSVAGLPQAIVFGDWSRGIPLRCIDTSGFKYLAMAGVSISTDAEYTATTENSYDKDGAVISAAGFTFYPSGTDSEGNVVAYFDFTSDQVASEPLSCSIQGLEDGIGTITGTAGSLIEHPADIVYYLLEHYTDLSTDDIGVESLKTMKALLPGLNFATIINSTTEVLNVIDRILNQCSYTRIQKRGKISVVGVNANGPTLVQPKRFDQVGSTVKISRTPDDKVCNDLLIQYGLNPATGKYELELTLDRTNSSSLEKSYYQYGSRAQVVLKYPDVQGEASARILANRYIDLHAFRHDIVERTTPIWEGYDVYEGDAGALTVEEGASSDGAGWSGEKCILIDRKIQGETIFQRWWRVAT